MSPPPIPTPPTSAPGLIGPVSILNWPVAGPRTLRRHRQRPYTHVHLEIDLHPAVLGEGTSSTVVRRIEQALREREVEESGNLLKLTGTVLHAFSAVGFLNIYHWEVTPGGWLPLPNGSRTATDTPLGHFLKALENPAWEAAGRARSLALRLGARGNLHADLVIRRLHRERRHAISLDLRGLFPEATVHAVVGALHERVALTHATVTTVAYQGA
ncbi:MAG: hypothetical protein ACRECT_08125 [Thermoplasmata archaeon]